MVTERGREGGESRALSNDFLVRTSTFASEHSCSATDVARAAVAIVLCRRSWGDGTLHAEIDPHQGAPRTIQLQLDDAATFLDVVTVLRGAVPPDERAI